MTEVIYLIFLKGHQPPYYINLRILSGVKKWHPPSNFCLSVSDLHDFKRLFCFKHLAMQLGDEKAGMQVKAGLCWSHLSSKSTSVLCTSEADV